MKKMLIQSFPSEQEWLIARKGKITGTKAGSLFGKRDGKPLKSYYEIIAERVALPRDSENRMDRGKRLEHEAVERFVQETGLKANTDLVIVCREDNPDIAYSPDAYIDETATVEVKCLNSAAHIEAWINKKIPSEYEAQALQPFVVNDKLQTLYFVFYDPSMPKDFFYLTVERKDVQAEVDAALAIQRRALEEIKKIEDMLTF